MLSGAAPSPSAHQSTTDARPGGARSREGVSLKVDGRERAHVWHMCNGIGARKAHACACSDPATHRDCVHDTTCCARPATGPSACPGCPRMSVCAKRVAKACKHDTSTSTSAFTVHARLTDLRAYPYITPTHPVECRTATRYDCQSVTVTELKPFPNETRLASAQTRLRGTRSSPEQSLRYTTYSHAQDQTLLVA